VKENIMRSITISIITIALLTAGLVSVPLVPRLLADEPPIQSPSPTGSGNEAGSATGAQAPTPPATAPTMGEEPVSPAETGDIQERGVLPGLVTPNLQSSSPTQFSAPTLSLSAIRNAMRITSKSISVNLRIPANLPVTVPVEVEVFYSSPFRSQILKRTYNSTSGLTLSYRDAEGNGEPRPMKLVITVRELVPNGQLTGLNKEFTITPLYDVFVTDLRFVMVNRCDTVGKSDITFKWFSPDGQHPNEQKFKLGRGEAKGITQFSWTRKEITTRNKLLEPSVFFDERDFTAEYIPPIGRSGRPLVPGPTTKYHFFLNELATGPPGQPRSGGCQAEITYTIIRALMPFDQF
jgi:hypothetical protein